MPKEARRKRRSLPSAIERNLSLEELLGEEQQSAKKKERQAKEQQALQLMASYYSMIDNVELAVEDTSSSASVSSTSGSESSPAKKNETRRIARKRERSATSLSTECGAKAAIEDADESLSGQASEECLQRSSADESLCSP
ncbi:hypothetical protein Gpo141_00007296 [Globisporangium polare]